MGGIWRTASDSQRVMICLPALPEQLAFGGFFHRTASNVKYQDAVVFDGKERPVSPGSFASRKRTGRWVGQPNRSPAQGHSALDSRRVIEEPLQIGSATERPCEERAQLQRHNSAEGRFSPFELR